MSTRRPVAVTALVAAALVITAGPAWAHAGFDVRQLPVDTTEVFELRVPIEIDSTNETVDVLVPTGWVVDVCDGADGWTCATVDRESGETVVNLARADDGAGEIELFTMTMTAPGDEGTYSFPVVQGYADGTEAAWIGDPGGDRPTPRIQVGDDTTPVERSTELPTHGELIPTEPDDQGVPSPSAAPSTSVATPSQALEETPDPSPEPTVTPSVASPEPTPELIAEPVADEEDDGGGGLLTWVVAAAAAAAAAAAVVVSRRR